jgi:hypothetical protein
MLRVSSPNGVDQGLRRFRTCHLAAVVTLVSINTPLTPRSPSSRANPAPRLSDPGSNAYIPGEGCGVFSSGHNTLSV